MKPVLLALVFSSLSGCGIGVGGSAFCDFRTGSSNGPKPRWQERVNSIAGETFKAACKGLQGAEGSGTCPRDNTVGGCTIGTQGDGSKVNDWYYPPTTLDEAKKTCASDNGTFLNP